MDEFYSPPISGALAELSILKYTSTTFNRLLYTVNFQPGGSIKKLILALVFAAAAGYGLRSYHYVLFDDSFKILKKTGVRYQNTFVDARGAKKLDILLMPDLIETGVKDVIGEMEKSLKTEQ